MLTFKTSALITLAAVLPASLAISPVQGMERQVRTATRAAELESAASVSNLSAPGQFPDLQQSELAPWETMNRLKQSEVVVRDRCSYWPEPEQTLEFDCEAVVLPANIGGNDLELIPEFGVTNLERFDPGLEFESLPLNSASDSPDPLGLGAQLKL